MTNEISNAVKAAKSALPNNLTWMGAFKSHGDATLALWEISGKVGVNDLLTSTDRLRLADKIVTQQTSAKEENTMTTINEAATAMLADTEQRQFLLAAAKHRRQLQENDTESIFDIAARLRTQVEAARVADAARRRPEATFDAAGHRPWRLTDDAWRHDRRRKQSTTHEFDPAGREANTYVTTEEDDEEDGKRNGKTEEAISDCYKQYQDELCNAWRMKK